MPPKIYDFFTSITICPCKVATKPDDNGLCPPCSTPKVLDNMVRLVQEVEQEKNKEIKETQITNDITLNKMATITGCDSERCVLESNYILKYMTPNDVKESLDNMKPAGPRTTREWLSNFNIDDVLEDFAEQYKNLYVFPTTMSDFKAHGDELAKVPTLIPKLYEEGKRYFASVINTDKYTSCGMGSCGKHWTAVFVDMSKLPDAPWTVEYFDSVGESPNEYVMDWQKEVKESLKEFRHKLGQTGDVIITENKESHQKENNECGVYSLYYIMSRVEGISQARFNSNPISDAAMINFRMYLFSG